MVFSSSWVVQIPSTGIPGSKVSSPDSSEGKKDVGEKKISPGDSIRYDGFSGWKLKE